MPIQRQSLNLANFHLSYLESNPGKEPLLLLHGLADHALVWSNLAEYLAPKYHIIAPDLRGHGESSKPKQGYTFREIIADLEALIRHLGWEKFHILGHSWSAKLVLIWANKHPELFQSMILVDPFFINKIPALFKVTFPLLYQFLPFLKLMQTFSSYQAAEKLAKTLKQYRGWSELQQRVFQAAIEQKTDGTWSSKFVIEARNQIFDDVMKVAGLRENIYIPTLFLKPKQGLNRTSWQLKPYKTYLKQLQIVEIPGNHWAFLVEPETFNSAVEKFLVKLT